jgi:restriction system protein
LSQFPEFVDFLQRARASTTEKADAGEVHVQGVLAAASDSASEAARAVGRPGDGGIDGVIDEDRLGLDVIYVQAKRWDSVVGRPEIQRFAGALQGQRARKGILITTSDFTREAEDYVKHIESRIILINGRRLARLMFDFDVGATPRSTYTVKQLDSDYFEDS